MRITGGIAVTALVSLAVGCGGSDGSESEAQWIKEVKAMGFVPNDPSGDYHTMYDNVALLCRMDDNEAAMMVSLALEDSQSLKNAERKGYTQSEAVDAYLDLTNEYVCDN